MLVLAAMVQGACKKTVVSVVDVSEVEVDPTELTLLEGARQTLTVRVTDEAGTQFSRPSVTWSADDDEVVTVDQEGGVVALTPGSTRVRATVGDVSGSAAVLVLKGPTLDLSRSTVELEATQGEPEPDTAEVDVRNAGNGALDQLSARVESVGGGPTSWLRAELLGTVAPTRLRLVANPEGFGTGTYAARVVVESAVASGEPVEVTVRLIVRAAGNPEPENPEEPEDPEDPDEPEDPEDDEPEDPEDPNDPGPTCDIRDRIIFGSLDVPRETSCTITNVRVLGDLRLDRGASVIAAQLRVDGSVDAKAADRLDLVDSRILDDLKFEEGGRATIRNTDVGDDLVLKKNHGELDVRDSGVEGDFTLEENRGGPFTLFRNTIGGKLECKGNAPAPTGGGNSVGHNGDGKKGQCSGL